MKWLDRLQDIDHRIIYFLLFIVTLVPLIRPIGIPLQVNSPTRAVYDIIEALDPATDIVLLSFDYSPGAGIDIHSLPTVVVEHLTMRGIKWVGVSFNETGPMMCNRIINGLEARDLGLEYGVDFVNLGYMAGEEAAIRKFALDSRSFTTDTRGNRTTDLPIMQGITNIYDFAFVHGFANSDLGIFGWLRQVVDTMGINFAVGVVTVSVPGTTPFYSSGQLKGLLGGLRGAAEYETLIEKPGLAVSMMDAQSVGHMLIIGFIFVGNLAYFLGKRQK